MNMVLDMNSRFLLPNEYMIDYAWLGGASAGLRVLSVRDPEWRWAPFIIDVVDTIELLGDIEEIGPGSEPASGSALDSLGGYVSLTGQLHHDGLYFPVSAADAPKVKDLLVGISVFHSNGWVLIPQKELPAFYRIVPLRGPLESIIQEEMNHD